MPSRRLLVACEYSGRVRDAFTRRGWIAVSCDIVPSDAPDGLHIQGDVRQHVYAGWDMMIAFPPCTDLSVIGAKYWTQKESDGRQQVALDFVRFLMAAPIDRIAIENPTGKINTAIRKPDQIIQPYEHGDPWRKRTCLWLTNLPKLTPTNIVEPTGHWVDGGSRVKHKDRAYGDAKFGGDTDEARKHQRSQSFQGIAEAMADQWGTL